MIIYNSLDDLKIEMPLCIALGSFDGLHKGHQKLIKRCIELAKKEGLKPAVFSFSNHPLDAIKGEGSVRKILSPQKKAHILEDMGVELLIAPLFTREIMALSPEAFIKNIILDHMDMKHAVCGFNYSFGYKAEGKPKDLRRLGRKYGYLTTVVREYRINGITASSTHLRQFIEEGDEAAYKEFTGRDLKEDLK